MVKLSSLLATALLSVSTLVSASLFDCATTTTMDAGSIIKPQSLALLGLAVMAMPFNSYTPSLLSTILSDPVSGESGEIVSDYGYHYLQVEVDLQNPEPEYSGGQEAYSAVKESLRKKVIDFIFVSDIEPDLSDSDPDSDEEYPTLYTSSEDDAELPNIIEEAEEADQDIRFQDWHRNFQKNMGEVVDNGTTIDISVYQSPVDGQFIIYCPVNGDKKDPDKGEGGDNRDNQQQAGPGSSFSCLETPETIKKHQCSAGSHLVKDVVQISCGHWMCERCADNYCSNMDGKSCPKPECGERLEQIDGRNYFPDKFIRKQMAKFTFACTNGRCQWIGFFEETAEHEITCRFKALSCSYADLGCNEKFSNADDRERHELDPTVHSNIIARQMPLFMAHMSQCHQLPCNGALAVIPGHQLSCNGATAATLAKYSDQSEIAELQSTVASLMLEVQSLKERLTIAPKVDQVPNSAIVSLIDKKVNKAVARNEDRDFRLSLLENGNYDGTIIWKIPQFSQRMEDARSLKYTSIFSLPFYSSRYGYKMCLRLYILGDGIGKGTHLSLFFVLMKGEFDAVLQWPFTYKVSFRLINQYHGRDVVDVFQPDPMSSSFQQPTTDMNVASGCPRFLSLHELNSVAFLKDDTIFIKAKVDVSTMKHP